MIIRPGDPEPRLVELPTDLVARYRAVDRELVPAPPEVADTPAHLDALEADVRAHGLRVPLDLSFGADWAALDGNHRIAVALRLGLPMVPVALREFPPERRPGHAKNLSARDRATLGAVWSTR